MFSGVRVKLVPLLGRVPGEARLGDHLLQAGVVGEEQRQVCC